MKLLLRYCVPYLHEDNCAEIMTEFDISCHACGSQHRSAVAERHQPLFGCSSEKNIGLRRESRVNNDTIAYTATFYKYIQEFQLVYMKRCYSNEVFQNKHPVNLKTAA